MIDPRDAFISAYLRGEELKLVTSDHINRLTKASSIQDALVIIRETDIGSYLQGMSVKTFDDLDRHLWQYLGECIRHIESFRGLPDDLVKILTAYIVKYDVSNIKAALQGISTGKKEHSIPIGVIHDYGLLDELFTAEDVDSVIELLITCKLGSYASIIKGYEADEGVESSLLTEARLNGEYYKNLLYITKDIRDGSVLTKAFGLIIDLTNLQIVSRAIIEGIGVEVAEYTISGGYMIPSETIKELLSLKLSDIPGKLKNTQYHTVAEEILSGYDRTKSITVVDEIIDKHKFRLSQGILSPRVLSPLVITWYLILKEVEIRNLRLILKAMFDNIPLEEIKMYPVLPS